MNLDMGSGTSVWVSFFMVCNFLMLWETIAKGYVGSSGGCATYPLGVPCVEGPFRRI